MSAKVRILILEDRPADAELVLREVRRAGYEPEWWRVETEAEYLAQLDQGWDLILADYNLPQFTGLRALELLTARGLDIPLIIVSGAIGEGKAVAAMKAGAKDYVMKDKLARLGSAIERELRDAVDRREFRQAEAALRLQSAALTAAANPMVITDRSGSIQWVNSAFAAVTGYDAEEAIGKNPRQLVRSGVHEPAFYKDMWDTILGGAVWQGEITNRRKDGTLYPEEMTITPVPDASGEIAHFVAIKQDLTRRKQLEAQLLQAQKMESVGRLAGGIAHDFNNLLTVILGTVDLSLADRGDADPLRADLQEVRKAAEQAARLTRQLLAFSRQQVLKPRILDLNEALGEMLSLLRRLLGEDVAVDFVPGIDLYRVQVDPGQMEQVLANLAINARDAMPDGGTLTIETRNVALDADYVAGHPAVRPGPHVQLSVRDTGIGMDESTRLQAFEPFFTTKSAGKGTGLGLSTVYGIVKQSGGTIWVESEPGRGSCFDIYLPRSAGPLTAAATVAVESASRGSETILIVEDEAALRALARRFLEGGGYTVLEAENGEAALACLERHATPVDLVLSDLVMPGMGGRELSNRMSDRFPQIQVVFTSGYTDEAILHQGPFADGSHFLAKPYTVAELRRKIREVLDSTGAPPTTA